MPWLPNVCTKWATKVRNPDRGLVTVHTQWRSIIKMGIPLLLLYYYDRNGNLQTHLHYEFFFEFKTHLRYVIFHYDLINLFVRNWFLWDIIIFRIIIFIGKLRSNLICWIWCRRVLQINIYETLITWRFSVATILVP